MTRPRELARPADPPRAASVPWEPCFLREPGPWLWLALAVGALLRGWLAFGTGGTLDVDVWASHAWEITQKGLIAYYQGGEFRFNHPPLMGELASQLYVLAATTGVPFAALLRLPFALLDLGTGLLLLALLGNDPRRFAFCAAWWLMPLAIVFSSYHGNTDSALAFFVTAAVVLVARGRPLAAGALLGVGLWIKVPIVLAAPALFFALASWRDRTVFCAAAFGVGVASYVPALLQEPRAVIDAVFLYPGLQIRTPAGILIWGTQVFHPDPMQLPDAWREPVAALIRAVYLANTWICVVPIAAVAWARRSDRTPLGVAGNVGASYALFHGFTNLWAFQYLAWALPLWLVAGGRFALPAIVLSTAYVYGLYAWLCDSWVLAGTWDFLGRPHWPEWLLWLRDAAILFFFASACFLLVRDLGRGVRGLHEPPVARS